MNFTLKDFFPEKIGSPRPGQLEVFDKLDYVIDHDDVKYYMIDAPVGTGKSAIVSSIIKYFDHKDRNSIILTPLKYLQDQYAEIFPEIPNIKGRANYQCPAYKDCDASNAPCVPGGECQASKTGKVHCPYYGIRRSALASPYFVSNFRYFLLAKNMLLGGAKSIVGARKRDILIIDEAHTISDEILSVLGFTLTPAMYGKALPKYDTALQYVTVLQDSILHMEEQLDEFEMILDMAGINPHAPFPENADLNPQVSHALKNYQKFTAASEKINYFLASILRGESWIPQLQSFGSGPQYVVFSPLRTADFIPAQLFAGFKKVFLLSGTFMQETEYAKEIGIGNEERMYTAITHPFPVKNRQVYYADNVANMGFKQQTANIPKMVDTLIRLFDHYGEVRGVVFTVSGALQEKLIQGLLAKRPGLESRIMDATPNNKEEVLRKHAATPAAILFTTSMWQGVDLKDDLSRFQIFVKVPYASLGDARIKTLAKTDKSWYDIQAAKVICQGYGRSIRTETDYADTWILDQCFGYYYSNAKPIFPPWFNEAIVYTKL